MNLSHEDIVHEDLFRSTCKATGTNNPSPPTFKDGMHLCILPAVCGRVNDEAFCHPLVVPVPPSTVGVPSPSSPVEY